MTKQSGGEIVEVCLMGISTGSHRWNQLYFLHHSELLMGWTYCTFHKLEEFESSKNKEVKDAEAMLPRVFHYYSFDTGVRIPHSTACAVIAFQLEHISKNPQNEILFCH